MSRDAVASCAAAALFSTALGLSAVALPLFALEAGYSPFMVGVLTAGSAVAQLASRPFLGAAMRIVADRTLMQVAVVALALSHAIAVFSAALVPFVIVQALQGLARACFWTGSQTHAVRGDGSALGALALVNLLANGGSLAGPLIGGFFSAHASIEVALAIGGVVAAVGIVPSLLLERFPPFAPRRKLAKRARQWRRPGVDAGCWAGVSAGAWRGLTSSYVPVLLAAAYSDAVVGVLVAIGNAGMLLGSGVSGWLRRGWLAAFYGATILTLGAAAVVVGLIVGQPVVVALALLLSGFSAGALQTIGPAIASDAVPPDERGDAITVSGTFRAAALFVAPLAVAGLVTMMPVSVALAVAGVVMTAPVVLVGRLRDHLLGSG